MIESKVKVISQGQVFAQWTKIGPWANIKAHFHKQLKSHKKKLTCHLAPWYFALIVIPGSQCPLTIYLFFLLFSSYHSGRKERKKKMTARKQTKKYNHLGVCKNIFFSSTNISLSAVTGSNKIAPSWLPTGLHIQHGCAWPEFYTWLPEGT